MSAAKDTFRANKGPLGLVLATLAGGCFFAGYRLAAEVVGLLAALLLGAGYMRDDRWEQDEQGQFVKIRRPWP